MTLFPTAARCAATPSFDINPAQRAARMLGAAEALLPVFESGKPFDTSILRRAMPDASIAANKLVFIISPQAAAVGRLGVQNTGRGISPLLVGIIFS